MRNWICAVWLYLSMPVNAQDYFYNDYYFEPGILLEAGVRTGFLNALADIGKKPSSPNYINEFNWKMIRPSFGLDMGLVIQRSFALRISITHGVVGDADSAFMPVKSESSPRFSRNLHYKTAITEVGLKSELHLMGLIGRSYRVSPYILAGTGIIFYDPKANLRGNWISLRALRSEGQGVIPGRKEYGKATLLLSAGAGLYFDISAGWSLRLEWDHRFLFTDYLDDVSTRFIDPDKVKAHLGEQSSELLGELYGLSKKHNGNAINLPGMIRGNPGRNDAIAGFSVCFSKVLNRRRV